MWKIPGYTGTANANCLLYLLYTSVAEYWIDNTNCI